MADRISIKNSTYEKGSCTKVQLPFSQNHSYTRTILA